MPEALPASQWRLAGNGKHDKNAEFGVVVETYGDQVGEVLRFVRTRSSEPAKSDPEAGYKRRLELRNFKVETTYRKAMLDVILEHSEVVELILQPETLANLVAKIAWIGHNPQIYDTKDAARHPGLDGIREALGWSKHKYDSKFEAHISSPQSTAKVLILLATQDEICVSDQAKDRPKPVLDNLVKLLRIDTTQIHLDAEKAFRMPKKPGAK